MTERPAADLRELPLPGGVAATIGGVQPLVVATLTWAVTRSRPRHRGLVIGAAAAVGVELIVGRPGAHVDTVGVLAALAASFSMAVVLTKHLPTPSDRIGSVSWQMILGSIVLVPLAVLAEGPLPPIGLAEVACFAYLSRVAPVTGAALGLVVFGESLTSTQLLGFVTTISAIALGVAHRRGAEQLEAPSTSLACYHITQPTTIGRRAVASGHRRETRRQL